MKNLKTIIRVVLGLLISVMVVVSGCESGGREQPKTTESQSFRVLGYLFAPYDLSGGFSRIDLSRITDLNIAFINPDEEGHFPEDSFFPDLLRKAKESGVRVFISIGGGDPPPYLKQLLSTEEGRQKMTQGIVNLLDKYEFDGVDVDLENDLIDEHYAPFVYSVSQAVRPSGKLVTAALASWNSNLIADSTLARYDFINVMSYDATGSWNPDNAGPHSLLSMAVSDFKYYTETRGIPPEKVLIGLPFYGYGFNGAPTGMTYREIVKTYPGSENVDELEIDGGVFYYNGMATIRDKTRFAVENNAGGVMIWQLLHDSDDDKSLLKVISEAINEL